MTRYVAMIALSAGLLCAQTNRGAISGTIKDQTGAVVPGANIVVTNLGTNDTRRATTSGSGHIFGAGSGSGHLQRFD
jgi:hypothetical protein